VDDRWVDRQRHRPDGFVESDATGNASSRWLSFLIAAAACAYPGGVRLTRPLIGRSTQCDSMKPHHHSTQKPLREPVVLALIILLAAAAGWILFERSTDLPPPNRNVGFELEIGSPTELPHYAPTFDAAGQLRVTDVQYFEDHGGTPDDFPYTGGTEAHIGVRFDRPVVGDASIQVVLELPAPVSQPNATNCRPSSPIEPLELKCSVERLPEYAEYRDALVMRGTLHGQSPPLAQDTVQSFGFTVHLSDIDGIGFRTSRSRVEAGFPSVPVVDGPSGESAGDGDDGVHVQYWIPDAGQMTWSGLPPIRVREHVAEWRPRSNYWTVQSSASGIPHDTFSTSNRYRFIAGLLFGFAGGALIPFVRALLRSSATRTPR
jgi:hypothetical protein